MAAEILDPASGSYVLDSTTGPTTATYSPNTSADYSGDGDIDSYALYDNVSAVFGGNGFLDSGAGANQVILFDIKAVSQNSNAKLFFGGCVDAVVHGAKNAGAGNYIEYRPGRFKLGGVSSGSKAQSSVGMTDGVQYYCRLTYDPAADTCQFEIFSVALDDTLLWDSGGVSMSGDSVAGGQPIFQIIDSTPRGKGTALYQKILSNVDYGQGGGNTDVAATTSALVLAEQASDVNAETGVSATAAALTLAAFAASVTLVNDVNVLANTATITVSTGSATVNAETSVAANAAGLTLASYQAAIALDVNVTAGVNALTLTAQGAAVNAETSIASNVHALILAEQAATVNAETNISTNVNTLAATTFAASVEVGASTNVLATVAPLTLTEQASTVNAETSISAGVNAITLAEQSAMVNAETDVATNVAALTVTENAATVNAETNVATMAPDALVINTYAATIYVGINVNVLATTDALSLTEFAADINAETNISTNANALTLIEYKATVSLTNPWETIMNVDLGGGIAIDINNNKLVILV